MGFYIQVFKFFPAGDRPCGEREGVTSAENEILRISEWEVTRDGEREGNEPKIEANTSVEQEIRWG